MVKSTSSLEPTSPSQPHNYRAQRAPTRPDSLASALHNNPKLDAGDVEAGVSAPSPPEPDDSGLAKPLNVNDALKYLDAVKARFQDQLGVYDQFLDIMAKFRGQK